MTEVALQEIKDDLLQLHVDVAFAEKNRVRWTLILMWLVLADLIHSLFDFGALLSLTIAFFAVGIYRMVDMYLILKGVDPSKDFLKSIKERGNRGE
jgi:uncharacterized membrane protein YjjP (DUF1212 family)